MSEDPDPFAIEVQARLVAALGLTSLGLVMTAPCGCGGTLPVAGAMAVGTVLFALRVQNSGPSRAGGAYATAGLYAAGIATLIVATVAVAVIGSVAISVWGTAMIAEIFNSFNP